MSEPLDPDELSLVKLALAEGVTSRGYCEWDARAAIRLRSRPPIEDVTLDEIREQVCEYVGIQGGQVEQRRERRPEYDGEFRYYYKVILPVADLSEGLFVEIILVDSDPEAPAVKIVNAH